MSIDDLGLMPTLEKYIEGFRKDTGTEVEFMTRGGDIRVKDSNIVLAIFRVVQECLNNIEKHAEATHVIVQLENTQNGIIVRVKDNGKGFDKTLLSEESHNDRGFGIMGMKERIELLEGAFNIESAPDQGTTIWVKLPFSLQEV